MASLGEVNWSGQQRADVPHLRMVESGVRGDLDALAYMLVNEAPQIVKGFELFSSPVGLEASLIAFKVASSKVLHPLASESGSIDSARNSKLHWYRSKEKCRRNYCRQRHVLGPFPKQGSCPKDPPEKDTGSRLDCVPDKLFFQPFCLSGSNCNNQQPKRRHSFPGCQASLGKAQPRRVEFVGCLLVFLARRKAQR
jgi:hypothetical protein